MKKLFILILLNLCFISINFAQTNFADKCLGIWKGTMFVYNRGELKDKVDVQLTVVKTAKDGDYTWKTEYFSKTRPMTKDYILRVKDLAKGIYITDEGGGVELINYLFENKLYNVFEVRGVTLTATYELKSKKELVFEVTSGKKIDEVKGITNYSVDSLQRIVFKKSK
jgi:hypothetical protein